jgi:hypothetical protein
MQRERTVEEAYLPLLFTLSRLSSSMNIFSFCRSAVYPFGASPNLTFILVTREVTHVKLGAKMPFHVCNYRENESGRDCRGEAWNDPSEISENQKFLAS